MSMPAVPARCRESTSSRLHDGSWDLHRVQQPVSSVQDSQCLRSTSRRLYDGSWDLHEVQQLVSSVRYALAWRGGSDALAVQGTRQGRLEGTARGWCVQQYTSSS